jgi:hypothetical protein
MNRNLQSPSGLTEFAPLSPEPSQPGVGFLLSKFFKLNRGKSHMEHLNTTVLHVPSIYSSASTSADSVSTVSVICSLLQPKKLLEN